MSNLLKLGRFALRQANTRSILVAKPFSTNPYLLKDSTTKNTDNIEELKAAETKEQIKSVKTDKKDDSTVLVSEKEALDLEADAVLKDQLLFDKLDAISQDIDEEVEWETNFQDLNPSDLSQFDPILDFTYDPYFAKNTHPQKFALKNEYPSQPPPADTVIEEKEEVEFSHAMGISNLAFRSLKKKVLYARSTVNMTAKGKIRSRWALVVVGNGNGAGGYGQAKAEDLGVAVQKATQRAIKNMVAFERYDNRTIYHDIEHKFKATNLKLFARPPGFGLRINMYIHEICQCLGFRDLSGKVYGSANPMNVVKAFFEAIQKQKTPQDIAKSRGKKLVDVQYRYYGVDA